MYMNKKFKVQVNRHNILFVIMSAEFKNLPQKYLQSNPNKTLNQPSQIFPIAQEFTIGRTHENSLQILDNTISKKHAKIITLKGLNYIYDLQSANGVYVNGNKISSQLQLEDGDSLQFGKYPCLYRFFDRGIAKNKSKGKGKINLKDYLFQQNAGQSKGNKFYSSAGIQNLQDQQSVLTQPISQGKIPVDGRMLKKKSKAKESKIKIPDLSDYLKLAGNEEFENETKINIREVSPKQKYTRLSNNNKKQGRIKLESLEEQIPSDEDLKEYNLQKRQRNIYVQEQEAYQKIESHKRKMEQQKLRKELEQAKIAQDLLQKQLLLEEKVREQQQKVKLQKQKLEQEFIRREQIKREQQLERIKEMENKQRQMMSKIQEQRNKQLEDLKNKQEIIKRQSENSYRKQYQKRKKQLEIQAEALARQYENIYRETIKKVRTQIDNEQNTIEKMEKKQQSLQKQSRELLEVLEQLQKQVEASKTKFIQISGRNKACVLYASDIQDKIDSLGNKQFMDQKEGYYKTNKSGAIKKLQDSILNSRKLLKIKQKEYENIIEEITAINGTIKERQYASTSDVSDFLDTVYENLQTIETLKQEYLQLTQSQRAVQQVWDAELQENTDLQNANRALQNEIVKNIRQIDDNSKDQIRKSTEQRLHLVKIMHFCPENKKSAAKFLIEEMLNLEQEVHKMRMSNEQIHKKIGKIIANTERIKRENQYLSEILFSQDQNGHHFDNMKIVINNLMAKIEQERNVDNVKDCLQLTRQADKFQLMIQSQLERKKGLRENMRKIGQMGLAPGQIKISEKNPLTFFGDMLTTKQIEIQKRKSTINHLENESNTVKSEIKLLEEKRFKISQALQKYKVQQISEAKKYLGRNNNS